MKITTTKKIENIIRKNILDGIWQPNTIIPSNDELMKIFSVGRNTLINAMIPLVEEGLITRKPKVGTIVLDKSNEDKNIVVLGQIPDNLITSYYLTELLNETIKLLNSLNIKHKICLGYGKTISEYIDSIHLFDKSNLESTCGIINLNSKVPIEDLINNKIPCVSYSSSVGFHSDEVVFDNAIIDINAINILKSHNIKSIGILNLITTIDPIEYQNYTVVKTQIENKNINLIEVKKYYKDIKFLDIYDHNLNNNEVETNIINFLESNKDLEAIYIDDDNLIWDIFNAIKKLNYNIPKDIKILTKSNKNREYGFNMNWSRLETDLSEVANMLYKTLKHAMNNKNTTPQGIKKFVVPTYISGNSL